MSPIVKIKKKWFVSKIFNFSLLKFFYVKLCFWWYSNLMQVTSPNSCNQFVKKLIIWLNIIYDIDYVKIRLVAKDCLIYWWYKVFMSAEEANSIFNSHIGKGIGVVELAFSLLTYTIPNKLLIHIIQRFSTLWIIYTEWH